MPIVVTNPILAHLIIALVLVACAAAAPAVLTMSCLAVALIGWVVGFGSGSRSRQR